MTGAPSGANTNKYTVALMQQAPTRQMSEPFRGAARLCSVHQHHLASNRTGAGAACQGENGTRQQYPHAWD